MAARETLVPDLTINARELIYTADTIRFDASKIEFVQGAAGTGGTGGTPGGDGPPGQGRDMDDGSSGPSGTGTDATKVPELSPEAKTAADTLQSKGTLSVPKGGSDPLSGFSEQQLRSQGVVSHTNTDGTKVYSYSPGGIGSHADKIGGAGATSAPSATSPAGTSTGAQQEVTTGSASGNEGVMLQAAIASGMSDPKELAQFMAQVSHESMGFSTLVEKGKDSYFKKYEGRKSLGNTQPGDGLRFKGRGFIQLTGRANYQHFGNKIGMDLINNPELAARPDVAAKLALAYWNERVKPKVKDFNDTKKVTKLINGGYNGLQDRMDRFAKYSNSNLTASAGASGSSSGASAVPSVGGQSATGASAAAAPSATGASAAAAPSATGASSGGGSLASGLASMTPANQTATSSSSSTTTSGGGAQAGAVPEVTGTPQQAKGVEGGLKTIKTKSGKSAQVAARYAGKFQGFINDLEATGYKIKDLGGYAYRANANNPNKLSYHSRGMAIDINPASNPNRSTKTDLPPQTGELAKKWGLGWGMNWKSVKDPMHFSAAKSEGGSDAVAMNSSAPPAAAPSTPTSSGGGGGGGSTASPSGGSSAMSAGSSGVSMASMDPMAQKKANDISDLSRKTAMNREGVGKRGPVTQNIAMTTNEKSDTTGTGFPSKDNPMVAMNDTHEKFTAMLFGIA